MSEKDIINQTRLPVTVSGMVHDFKQLGIQEGDHVLVHSSLSSIGWVCGGPQAVIQALLQSIGDAGTLVMPAQSGDWSDPAEWGNPPVPQEWIDIIYKEMPAFDAGATPTRGMGRIAEVFRTYPGTLRSNHPQVSFCANGRHASYIVADHPLTPQFGEDSPLGKLYTAGAKVLLLGAGFDSCTSLHLAETRLQGMPTKKMGTAMLVNGRRTWKWFMDYAYNSDDFEELGRHFAGEATVTIGQVGQADSILLDMKEAVDYAGEWLAKHRYNY